MARFVNKFNNVEIPNGMPNDCEFILDNLPDAVLRNKRASVLSDIEPSFRGCRWMFQIGLSFSEVAVLSTILYKCKETGWIYPSIRRISDWIGFPDPEQRCGSIAWALKCLTKKGWIRVICREDLESILGKEKLPKHGKRFFFVTEELLKEAVKHKNE